MLDEGTTFIFGSWACVADGAGSFRWHFFDDMKSKAFATAQHSDLNEFIDNLNETLLPDLAKEIEEESTGDATSTRAAPGLLESHSDLRKSVPDSCSGYAMWLLSTSSSLDPSSSPYWKRTRIIYSSSGT
jgi:hypothetical protein